MSNQLKSIKVNLDYVEAAMKNTDQMSKGLFKAVQEEASLASKKLADLGTDVNLMEKHLSDLKKPIRDGTEEFDRMKLKIENIANYALGNLLAGALSRMAQGIKNTVSEAVTLASDLKEVQNIVDVTFADKAGSINNWSQNLLESHGLGELAAKNYAGTMGSMLKAAGLSQQEVVNMSKALTELSGDVASFRNIKPEEAFQKLTSVVSGETKPMRALGVNMTIANLQAYALSQGINKTWNEMSQAEQVTLRYNYVMAALKDIQGDFARTSHTYANQQRMLSENWKKFTSTIATYVLPWLELLMQGLNKLVSFLTAHADTVGIILVTLVAILGVLGAKLLWVGAASVVAGAKAAIAWVGALWPVIAIIAAVGLLIAVLNEFGISVEDVVGFAGGAFGALAAFVYNIFAGLMNFIGAFAVFLMNVFKNPLGAVQVLFYDMSINVISYIRSIAQAIEDLLNSIPKVEVDITSGMDSLLSDLEAKKKAVEEANNFESFKPLEFKDIGDTWNNWSKSAKKGFKGLTSFGQTPAQALPKWSTGTLGNDKNIDKVGKVGKIEDDVSITDEDIELLKDVATVDYVNKFVTMNPNISVAFGDVHETADVNELTEVISDMIKEAAATALV